MGSSSSKAAARATGSAARRYPTRPANATPAAHAPPSASASRPGPTVHPSSAQAQPSETRSEAVDLDARDPHFAEQLRKLGPVQPNPTYSPSSRASFSRKGMQTPSAQPQPDGSASGGAAGDANSRNVPPASSNPALAILAARQRVQTEVDEEKQRMGRAGYEGKKYLEVSTVRKALALRDEQGMDPAEIERFLGLKKGMLRQLGRVGVVEAA